MLLTPLVLKKYPVSAPVIVVTDLWDIVVITYCISPLWLTCKLVYSNSASIRPFNLVPL